VKVAFAFSFLFVEEVGEQVRLLVVQQHTEQGYCTNNRFNIGDNKKKKYSLDEHEWQMDYPKAFHVEGFEA